MEGNELNSISSIKTVSGSSSHPLFCTIVALWTLILLYFPHFFIRIVFSPVLTITETLLLTLLHVGAAQRNQVEKEECDSDREFIANEPDTDSEPEPGFVPDLWFEDSFVEWNVRAPLEVIYEADEEEHPNPSGDNEGRSVSGPERHPTLSVCYPDSDSDSSSEGGWDLPENICFRWDEEDREGLIEIALDGKKRYSSETIMDFQGEEGNLIEIDISPLRMDQFPGDGLGVE